MKGSGMEEQAQGAKGRLRQARDRMEQAAREAQVYRAGEPAPYQPEAAELAQSLEEVRRRYESARRSLPEEKEGAAARTGGIHKLTGYLARRQAGRQAKEMDRAMRSLEAEVERAEGLVGILKEEKPRAARERWARAGEGSKRIDQAITELRGAGAHGPELDLAAADAGRLNDSLEQAGDWLAAGAGSADPGQAIKEGVIQAWQALEGIEAPLARGEAQLAGWLDKIREIRTRLTALEQAIEAAERLLDDAPDALDVSEQAAALEGVRDNLRRLASMAASPEVGQLDPLLDDISRDIAAVSELSGQVVEAGRWLEELVEALGRCGELGEEIAARMDEAAHAAAYPIGWGSYQARLDRLRAEQASIGEIAGRWTPYLLRVGLDRAARLYAELEELSGRVDQVRQQRLALIALAGRLEMEARRGWLERAVRLAGLTEEWAAENWAAQLEVGSIGRDAEALRQLIGQCAPDAWQQIPAERIGQMVSQAQALVGQIDRLQDRLDRIERALAALVEEEQAIRRALELALGALGPLVEALRGAAVDRQRQELEGRRRDGAGLLNEVGQRSTGRLERKGERADRWAGACLDSILAARKALLAEIEQKRPELRREVEGLKALGEFDLVEAMAETRRLLGGRRQAPALPGGKGREGQAGRIVAAAGEAGGLIEERGRCLGLLAGLRAEIGEPLRRPRERWERMREQAAAAGKRIEEAKRELGARWPPLAGDFERAEGRLEKAREAEARLGRSRTVAESRERMEGIARCYEEAIEEMEEGKAGAEEEWRQLKETAERIQRWERQLGVYGQTHADDEAAAEAIRRLAQEVEDGLGALKKRWGKRPPSFRESREALQELWLRVYGDVELGGRRRAIRARDIEGAWR